MSRQGPTVGEWDDGIYRRSKDSYLVTVSIGTKSNRFRRAATVSTWTEAKAKKQDLLKQRHGSSAKTLGEFLNDWLDRRINDPAKLDRKPARSSTVARYRGLVEKFVIPTVVEVGRRTMPLGEVPIGKVETKHIKAVRDSMKVAGAKPRSIQQCRAVLRVALNDAVSVDELIPNNPALAVRVSDVTTREIEPPSTEAVDRLLGFARGSTWWLPILLGRYTGFRRGEILGARWTSFDAERGSLRVSDNLQRTLVNGRWTLEILRPKTDRSQRTVFLPPFVVAALKAHRVEQDARRMKAGEAWRGVKREGGELVPSEWAGLIFDDGLGGPVDVQSFSKAFKRLAKRAGIPKCRLHDLRHAAASAMIDMGMDLKTVSDVLGHADPNFTARRTSTFPTRNGSARQRRSRKRSGRARRNSQSKPTQRPAHRGGLSVVSLSSASSEPGCFDVMRHEAG